MPSSSYFADVYTPHNTRNCSRSSLGQYMAEGLEDEGKDKSPVWANALSKGWNGQCLSSHTSSYMCQWICITASLHSRHPTIHGRTPPCHWGGGRALVCTHSQFCTHSPCGVQGGLLGASAPWRQRSWDKRGSNPQESYGRAAQSEK